ncbi:MAG: hypothetical protein LQ350_005765 [Teloschistes chrysophthalmus]|nr:MAG: hypothetical protein LQ350_005765 [Niorma chrysophthalma]
MADQLLQQAQDIFEGQIDFEGQKLAELFSTIILTITALLALALGFYQQSIWVTLWVGLGGTAATFFVVVPPWPIYNENPEKWLRANSAMSGAGIEVDGKRIK